MGASIVVIWSRFGPYHLARLSAAGRLFRASGVEVVGLEVAASDSTYAWEIANGSEGFRRVTLFPDREYGSIRPSQIASAVSGYLESACPSGIAVAGWSFPESMAAVRWSRREHAAAVLMSESKHDDAVRHWWTEQAKHALLGCFGAALVGGEPHRAYLAGLGYPSERVFLGYDAIDNGYFMGRADRAREQGSVVRARLGLPPRMFLACARFIPKKNLDRLVRAHSLYAEGARDPWHLVVCGDGPMRAELEAMASALCPGTIHWPGFTQIDALPEYYGLASAFVLPSTTEQWGLVVNEAMASALPVLVSQTAGCRYDLVQEGENGYLFDPYDVEDMARVLLQMAAASEQRRRAMGLRSREIIGDWGPERFAKGLWDAYVCACTGSPGVRGLIPDAIATALTHPWFARPKRSRPSESYTA